MDETVIEKLKQFEAKQESLLEEKKSQFLHSLEEKKKDLIDKHQKDLVKTVKDKQNLLKKAKAKAKKDAIKTIEEFKEKTKKLEESSSDKVDKATNAIFEEFLNQNV